MASPILDVPHYPFHEAAARELHMVLSQMYPAAKAAMLLAQKSGIGAWEVNADQAPYLVWKDILEVAATSGVTRPLVQFAADQFPKSPFRPFLADLLANKPPPPQAEPRDAEGAPNFRHGSDDISEPEALLFHDDLTLPTGQLARLIGALERLRTLLPAVCRLEVTCPLGVASGTGFRIAKDLLLTNFHVLYPEGTKPSAITATFGYEDDAQGVGLTGLALGCVVDSIKADEDYDWGVLRVAGAIDGAVPILPLGHGIEAKLGSPAFLIQHPGGQRKRIAYARNQITHCDPDVVQYLSDTQVGSSGSPVLDEAGNVVALHHAGGRPQEVAGQQPLKKNEGIAIARVAAGIAAAGIAL